MVFQVDLSDIRVEVRTTDSMSVRRFTFPTPGKARSAVDCSTHPHTAMIDTRRGAIVPVVAALSNLHARKSCVDKFNKSTDIP